MAHDYGFYWWLMQYICYEFESGFDPAETARDLQRMHQGDFENNPIFEYVKRAVKENRCPATGEPLEGSDRKKLREWVTACENIADSNDLPASRGWEGVANRYP